jgi:uncharacterized membrane protein
MTVATLIPPLLIGVVAGARPMTPMAALAAADMAGRRTPGRLWLLDRPVLRWGAVASGLWEVIGDKMRWAPDRTVPLGLLARAMSAGIAGAALSGRGRDRVGAMLAIGAALPMAYATLAARKKAMRSMGQTRSGLVEDAIFVTAGLVVVRWAIARR